MKKLKLVGLTITAALIAWTISAQELGYTWNASSYHITTSTTRNIVGISRLAGLTLGVSDAGTSWQIQVKTMESTPKILATWVTANGVGTFVKLAVPNGITMPDGISIVSSGTTAGVADLFVTRRGAVDATPTPSATATSTPTPTPG